MMSHVSHSMFHISHDTMNDVIRTSWDDVYMMTWWIMSVTSWWMSSVTIDEFFQLRHYDLFCRDGSHQSWYDDTLHEEIICFLCASLSMQIQFLINSQKLKQSHFKYLNLNSITFVITNLACCSSPINGPMILPTYDNLLNFMLESVHLFDRYSLIFLSFFIESYLETPTIATRCHLTRLLFTSLQHPQISQIEFFCSYQSYIRVFVN